MHVTHAGGGDWGSGEVPGRVSRLLHVPGEGVTHQLAQRQGVQETVQTCHRLQHGISLSRQLVVTTGSVDDHYWSVDCSYWSVDGVYWSVGGHYWVSRWSVLGQLMP